MNTKILIEKHFSFLINDGFHLKCDNLYNIMYTYTFTNTNDCKIIVSIDLRVHYVNIKIKNKTKILLSIEYGGVMRNHTFEGLEKTLPLIENIYQETRISKRGFSKECIDSLLTLYADFVSLNYLNIINAMQ